MTAQVRPSTGGTGAVLSVNARTGAVTGLAEAADLATEIADREATDTAHAAAGDPHPGYLTPAEGNAAYEALGAAAAAQAAAIAASQPVDADLTAISLLATTAYGRSFLTLADAAAGRTALGLGTAATSNTGDFDAAGAATAAQAASQPLDSDLTAIAALSTTSFGRSLLALADAAAGRTALGLGGSATLAVGTTAGTVAAGDDSRITGAAQKASNLSDLANAGTARTNLGLGTAATSAASDFEAVAGHTSNSVPAASGSTSLADLVMGASTILARLAAGNIVAATPAQLKTLLAIAEADVTGLVADLAAKASTAHHATHEPSGSDPMAVDAVAATGSLRTLGTGATQAAAGNDSRFNGWAAPLPSGKYIAPPGIDATPSTGSVILNNLTFSPIFFYKAVTVDRIGLEVIGNVASSVMRLGIYGSTSDLPGALILDAGTIDSSTTGYKEITISQALGPGLYYLVAVSQGGASASTWRAQRPVFPDGNAAATLTVANSGSWISNVSTFTGALPNPAPALASGNGSVRSPRVLLRVA